MRIYMFVLFCCVSTLTFAVSCQGQSDLATSEKLFHTDRQSGGYLSQKDKQKRWEKGFVYVTKVIDGDTFWIDNGSEKVKVRFIGIDAPETRNTRHKQKGYFAQEAEIYVRNLTEKKWVRLETDVQLHDHYGRLLAYIYLEDGTLLNADLVAGGYAVVDTYPPNVKHVELFTNLQKQARDNGLGLWKETIEAD